MKQAEPLSQNQPAEDTSGGFTSAGGPSGYAGKNGWESMTHTWTFDGDTGRPRPWSLARDSWQTLDFIFLRSQDQSQAWDWFVSPPASKNHVRPEKGAMSATKARINRYVVSANHAAGAGLGTVVVAAGSVAIPSESFGEIVYQDLSISLEVPSLSTGVTTRVNIGDLGWIQFGGWQQSMQVAAGGSGTSSSPGPNKIKLFVDEGKSKKGNVGPVSRFSEGDEIGVPGPLKGWGDFSTGSTGGNFNAQDGPVSGYIGWGYLSEAGVQGFGWLSLTWDGSLLEIDGYAYETDYQTTIEAGAIPGPGALGLLSLAAGASGLRRKRAM